MSVNLETVLKNIQTEKNTKLTANNLRYGVECMGIKGGLHPVTIEGGDIGRAIYLQDTTPEDPNGIWINTDKTYDNIYLENERYATDGSIVFSNADTTDTSNPIANHTNNGLNLMMATYAQKDNVVHFFGFHSTTASAETTALVHRHWKYDFDTNTWTQLSDCPTPQGGVKAVWIGDYIYIFGTAYTVNTDYRQYAYKYDTINDTWERIADLPTVATSISTRGLGCVYDNNDNIYILSDSYHYCYTISTNTYTALTSPSNYGAGYNNGYYYNNYIYYQTYICRSNWYFARYNIATGTWSNIRTSDYISSSEAYTWASVGIGNRFYSFSGGSYTFQGNLSLGTSTYAWMSLDNTSNYKRVTTVNPYSNTVRSANFVPVCVFTTDRGPVIVFFCGITSGTTINTNNQIGNIIQDKDYSDLENNTLIIYTTNGSMGTYITALYQDDKTINGKIYQRFNDVNFWDAGNQTLIKNLRTYYGNGTEWVQIK